ncbi:ShlB/FhaC/HecB family hemolysin secretion/activation protein [Pseudomonas coleopterorum]|uniref:ShlB/FhaC/HecB family hemolysin secretion/activation protein n=1 Tax=Pseudomonas coleopterorum TaxID=1605838 RepID=A0AAJ6M209_9PSED|nr:ShlB/FhaC/HecB family hemolysin secretion/activation protein [Pseudomonas coleopterorum]WNC10731.1 ShlB/FhaC/HecB family hemolysin secretion/activation protein [Pseudomonas coleopterorum]
MTIFRKHCLLSALLFGPALALADTNAPQVDDQLLRQFDSQRLEREAAERAQRLETLRKDAGEQAAPSPQQVERDTDCWPVSAVRVQDNQLLDTETLQAVLQPWVSPCIGINDVNQMLIALTGAYVKAGYVAARPYVVQPPEAGGDLVIAMLEGFVESIEMADGSTDLSLGSAFPAMIGRPLKLTDVESGLDQLNRLRSVDLTLDIAPGEQVGGTRIILRPGSTQKSWTVGTGLNNRGSDSSGRHQAQLSLSLDNPLHLNDSLAASYAHSLDAGAGYSRQGGLFYEIPYGRWTLNASASRFESQAPLPNRHRVAQSLDSYGLKLDRGLWRNQTTLLNAHLRLDQTHTDLLFDDTTVHNGRTTLSVASVGLNLTHLGDSVWTGYLGYARGQGWLGGDRTPLRHDAPQPHFEKYRGTVTRRSLFDLLERRWAWNTELDLQYSPDPLPSLEQLRLASSSGVRGYRLDSQPVSQGATLRNTLSTSQRLAQGLYLTPRAGLDAGWGQHTYNKVDTQHAIGVSAGVILSWADGQIALDYQRGLQRRGSSTLEPGFWIFGLSQAF